MPEDTVKNNDTLETPKASWVWIRNSQGQPSATLTFVTVAFIVTTIAYVASMFEQIGPVTIRQFDPAACAAFLGSMITLYATRRYTEAKFGGVNVVDQGK